MFHCCVQTKLISTQFCRSSCCHRSDSYTSGFRYHSWCGRVHLEKTTKSHVANVSNHRPIAGLGVDVIVNSPFQALRASRLNLSFYDSAHTQRTKPTVDSAAHRLNKRPAPSHPMPVSQVMCWNIQYYRCWVNSLLTYNYSMHFLTTLEILGWKTKAQGSSTSTTSSWEQT